MKRVFLQQAFLNQLSTPILTPFRDEYIFEKFMFANGVLAFAAAKDYVGLMSWIGAACLPGTGTGQPMCGLPPLDRQSDTSLWRLKGGGLCIGCGGISVVNRKIAERCRLARFVVLSRGIVTVG